MNENGQELPVKTAAAILDVTRMTLYNWRTDGRLADLTPASIQGEIERQRADVEAKQRRLDRALSLVP